MAFHRPAAQDFQTAAPFSMHKLYKSPVTFDQAQGLSILSMHNKEDTVSHGIQEFVCHQRHIGKILHYQKVQQMAIAVHLK